MAVFSFSKIRPGQGLIRTRPKKSYTKDTHENSKSLNFTKEKTKGYHTNEREKSPKGKC